MSGLSKALTRVAKFMVVKDARYLTGQPPAAVRSFSYPTREKPDTWSDLGRSTAMVPVDFFPFVFLFVDSSLAPIALKKA
jgi:hypothetical protein